MPTVSKRSFATLARQKAEARCLDQQLVNQGCTAAVQKKNDLFQSIFGAQLKTRPITLRQRLCLTPQHK